jgi:hypothetical protein
MAITHILSATTPDDPAFEIRPSHWNDNHAQNITIVGNTSGASTISGTNIVLSAGPNMTISVNGGSLVWSGGAGAAGNTGYLSAGTTYASLGTVSLSNANGLSFGVDGQTITASHNALTSQSNQAFSADASSTFQTLTFQNSNGVSFSNNAGALRVTHDLQYTSATSAITSAALHTSASRVINVVAATNNTGGGTASLSSNVSFSNANGLSFYTSAGNAVVGSYTVPGATVFSNSNNVSFGLNGSTITATATFAGGAGFSAGVSTGGNTSGDTGVTGTRLVFAGGNNVTLSQGTDANGATITISGANAGGAQTGISGIIVSDATYTSGTVSFSNQNGVTIGSSVDGASQYIRLSVNTSYLGSNASSNYVHVSGSATTVSGVTTANVVGTRSTRWAMEDHQHEGVYQGGLSTAGNTAGNTFLRPGRIAFQGSNAITLSGETAAGSLQTIHIQGPVSATTISGVTSANVIGTRGSRFALEDHQHEGVYHVGLSTAGNTAGNTFLRPGRIAFQGSNAITLSGETAANSLQTIHIQGPISATTISGVTSANVVGTRGSRFALEDHQHVGVYSIGVSTGGNTAGDTAVRPGQVVFVGGNNITLSGATAAGSLQTITISAGAGGGAAISLPANGGSRTSGGAGYSNISTGTANFFGNNITMSQDGASITISANAPGAAAENNWFNLSGDNTAGNTTASGSTIGISVQGALTISGTNGSQIKISAPATSSIIGSSGISISSNGSTITVGRVMGSYWDNMEGEWPNSTTMQMLQSTSHVQPFMVDEPISFAVLRIPMSLSNAASSTGVTTGNSSWSYGHSRSHNFVIYSRGVGASSLSLQSVASTQLTDQQSIRVSAAAGNSTQFSYTNRATYQMSTGAVDYTYDYSSSAASLNFHTSGMTAATGLKMMEFPWATSLAPGQYWLAYGVSSSTASQYTAQGTRLFNIMSNYGMSQPNLAFGTIGGATNSSVGPYLGHGSFTTAGGGTTASMPISAVTTTGSHNKMFFQLFRIA